MSSSSAHGDRREGARPRRAASSAPAAASPTVRPSTAAAAGAPGAPAARRAVAVIGGVAGGASAAARLRRLDESCEIVLFERGPYVSFANCGLPYYVGGVIEKEASLLVANAKKFHSWFNIKVLENTEVTAIDRASKTLATRDVRSGATGSHAYDALVLSPGAAAVVPPLPGVDLPGIFQMKTVPDSSAVKAWIEAHGATRAVVVGGGFIGLEMTDQLVHRGIHTTLVEMQPQVMPSFDPEMVEPLQERLRARGVTLRLGESVKGFEQAAEGSPALAVLTSSGARLEADLAMLVMGVRPETQLARDAGLELGPRGGIKVDEHMRTSDPSIWAVGDAVEVKDWVTGEPALIPLAGPANRQGRIAADNIAGVPSTYRGSQGTSVVGVLGITLAATGASEKALKRAGLAYEKVYVHANNHAGYYPGAKPIDLKLLFDPKSGAILGVQATSEGEGADKAVDAISAFMQKRGTVFDLEEAELCYAPQYGSAKSVVNFAGMVASNVVRGDMPVAHWDQLAALRADPHALMVDVREPAEVERGAIEGAVNIPLPRLRSQLAELPRDKRLYVYCAVGLRGYLATRQLLQAGFDAANVSGGWRSALQCRL